MLRQWLIQQRLGLLVGAATTVAAALGYGLGWTEQIELQLYDGLVRGFSTVPASNRILHIDIDDDALQRYESWPWPRDVQGELLTLLHELGAAQTIVDLVWTEPRGGELRLAGLDAYADLEGEIAQMGEVSAENAVFPDDELAYAAHHAGPLYLSFYYDQQSAGTADGGVAAAMTGLLWTQFGLTAEELAQRLNRPLAEVQARLAGTKRAVARELVAQRLTADPLPSARQVHESLLQTPFDRPTADREDILSAYHRERGLRNFRRLCPPVPSGLIGRLPVVRDVMPPLYKLTEGTPRLGFVNFDTISDADGTLRRIPLVVEWDGVLLEQLAFAAIRDALNIRPDDLSIDDAGYLVIAAGRDRPAVRIQLDEHGRARVNWHSRAGSWSRCFGHLPVTQLLQIHDIRKSIRDNERLKLARLGEAMRLAKDEAGFAAYREKVVRWLERRRFARSRALRNESDSPEARQALEAAAALDAEIRQDHETTGGLIRETWAELEKEPDPSDPEIAAEYKRFREASRLILEAVPEIDDTNRRLAAREAELIAQLRPLVTGKTCFLGYTATALADMVTAPPYGRMPGVLVHSQLYNSLLQGRFRTWSRSPTTVGAILALGLAVTAVSTLRGPRGSLAFVLAAIGAALLANAYGLFGTLDHWLPLLTALILIFVAWALIVMVRYLVTDRQRRRFSRAVAQYVSPAMARRIAESAQGLSFDPTDAVVTCLFSDIAGFTTLSEELGPAGTKSVLNPYLESMSAVLHRHEALINKFMGDGVFAFFNPPILPCPDHPVAACEAALDSQAALAQLVVRHGDSPLAPYFRQLSIRIGIASGPVFVGDYGSQDKLDYTCVGDVVNLAARLESANKQFGTSIIVSGPTRDAAGAAFVYRNLGTIQVKGKTQGVPVYELLGRRGQVDGSVTAYADQFEQAVLAFSRREFEQAAAAFQDCLRCRPADVAAQRYLPVIDAYKVRPPDASWEGSLELTEK